MAEHSKTPWGPSGPVATSSTETRANFVRRNACVDAFHDATRSIPTEAIEEGVFWRIVDEVKAIYEMARRVDWQMKPYSAEDAFDDLHSIGGRARALLSSLKVEQK